MMPNRVKNQTSEEQLGVRMRRKTAKVQIYSGLGQKLEARIINSVQTIVQIVKIEPYKRPQWRQVRRKDKASFIANL